MKYESSILKRLIDTYGVMGNPRYISEIIKEFIVRGKERFPELFTYQADWLAHIDEFGLTPDYVVSYTGQHIYAPNTKEKPVKRAILTGSTKYRDIDTGEILETFEEGRNLELVSVKMPVLTTTAKNLFDGKERLWFIDDNGIIPENTPWRDWITDSYIQIKGDTPYFSNVTADKSFYFYDSNKKFISLKHNIATSGVTSPTNARYLLVKIMTFKELGQNVAIYEGEYKQVDYEPYKSNILTVNEDVTLRGIGSVSDELNLLMGESTQRVGEVVFDGSEDWVRAKNGDGTYRFGIKIKNMYNNKLPITSKNIFIKADNLPIVEFTGDTFPSTSSISAYGNDIVFYIYGIQEIKDFKAWLSQNPITIQYQLATESIKTVDLSILDQNGQSVDHLKSFNGGTHVYTSSLEGSLVPSVDISVVTNLEETLKMCSLDGNTL